MERTTIKIKKGQHSSSKRKRFHWDDELQSRFHNILQKLGKRATPARILRELKVPNLTREQVSSHLQRVKTKDSSFLLMEPVDFIFMDETSKVIVSAVRKAEKSASPPPSPIEVEVAQRPVTNDIYGLPSFDFNSEDFRLSMVELVDRLMNDGVAPLG